MRLLLDTNALLWQLGLVESGRLGKQAKDLLQTAEVVYVSAVSIIEMQIKTMNGKLNAPINSSSMVEEAGDELIDLSPQVADALRKFPKLSKHDPFDRLLLAQASVENLTLLTSDNILLGLGLEHVIDARI